MGVLGGSVLIQPPPSRGSPRHCKVLLRSPAHFGTLRTPEACYSFPYSGSEKPQDFRVLLLWDTGQGLSLLA